MSRFRGPSRFSAVCCLLVTAGWLLQPLKLAAQEGPPRFLLTADGPIGAVRSLVFTPDSRQLLSGGSDKFVSLWGLSREGAARQLRVTLAERLFWEISRGARGHIYALAVSPDGKYVAVGGYSARDASGDIHLFNLRTLDWERVLKGHRQTINSLAFSPDSRRLISISKDGEARLWSSGEWTSQAIQGLGGGMYDSRPVVFLSNTTAAIGMHTGEEGRWYVGLCDVTTRRIRRMAQLHSGRVESLAYNDATGAWASADRAGNIYYWESRTAPSPVRLRKGRIAAALTFGPKSSLLASTIRDERGESFLEMWNTRTKALIDEMRMAKGDHTYACAVSPDGALVAAPSDQGSIMLFPLKDAEGQPFARPLSDGAPVRAAGNTGKLWHVAFDRGDSYRLAIGTKQVARRSWDEPQGVPLQAFDLGKVEAFDLATHKGGWRTPRENADGWRARRLESGREVEVSQGDTRCRIVLDRTYQGPAECYTFLHDEEGKPYAIAIGTSQQYGIFVYELPRRGRCRLLRYYRDHYGEVTSLSCSSDGQYLASASVDGSVKVWSLKDLLAPGREFRQEAAWGAVFRPKGDRRLVVAKSDPAGITARRELEVGDEIIRVLYERNGQAAEADTADEMLAALEGSSLWQTVVLSVLTRGEGETRRVLLVPAWEPLASLVIDRRGEWVMWTPQGFYDASIAGDELVGWILNGLPNRPTAKFFRADRFRMQLEKPEIMRGLLTARSLPGALENANVEIPRNLQDQVTALAKRLPSIKILKPQHDEVLARGQSIVTEASFEFPDRADMDAFDAALYVNGIPIQKPVKRVQGNTAYYQWETPPPNQYNSLRVVAQQEDDPSLGDYSDARVTVRADTQPAKARLHFIGLAAEDYPGELRLEYCLDDIQSVVEALQKSSGRHYDMPKECVLLRTDHDITKENVIRLPKLLQEQAGEINSHDVLIVYLAGHGVALSSFGTPPEYYFVPPDAEIVGFDEDLIRQRGIAWKAIKGLAELPCRKIFMIDTCFQTTDRFAAGNAAINLELAIRPLRQRETLVITGCGLGQKSWQAEKYGHGLFTHAVLEGLSGFADGFGDDALVTRKDRVIELRELVGFVRTQVPQLAAAEQTPQPQTPSVSSTELGYVPLVDY